MNIQIYQTNIKIINIYYFQSLFTDRNNYNELTTLSNIASHLPIVSIRLLNIFFVLGFERFCKFTF